MLPCIDKETWIQRKDTIEKAELSDLLYNKIVHYLQAPSRVRIFRPSASMHDRCLPWNNCRIVSHPWNGTVSQNSRTAVRPFPLATP